MRFRRNEEATLSVAKKDLVTLKSVHPVSLAQRLSVTVLCDDVEEYE